MDTTPLDHLSFDAPYASPEHLFGASQDSLSEALFWDDGTSIIVGLGAAARASGSGPNRWDEVRRHADLIFRRLDTRAGPGAPRFFGRATFAEHAADFVLPAWTYRVDTDGRATISVVVPRSSASSDHGRTAVRRRALDRLDQLASTQRIRGGRPTFVRQPDSASWRADVEAALRDIAAGRLRKVVAARPFDVTFDAEPSVADVLRSLGALGCGPGAVRRGSGAVRFAFRRHGSTLLSLTPERLVAVRGNSVRSEALAGTAPEGPRDAARLLASPKDGHEHRLVVDEIADRLRTLCTRLLYDATPRLRAASGVQHLLTPIEGELRQPVHLLELGRRLHPTPAVCGLPTEEARRWIAEHETASCGDRGCYAGAVGHFDGSGDGELRVALRSAWLRGDSGRVWSGAGLVAGSDPDRELEEITSKARTMLHALESRVPAAESPVHVPFTRPA